MTSLHKRSILVASIALAVLSTQANGQQRSRAGGSEAPKAPVVLPDIPADPARPLVGVWQGEMTGSDNNPTPYTLVIEYLNGKYAGYSVGPLGRVRTHEAETATDRSFHWEQPNGGGGTLVFDVALSPAGILRGTMKLVGGNSSPPDMSLTLRRRTAKK